MERLRVELPAEIDDRLLGEVVDTDRIDAIELELLPLAHGTRHVISPPDAGG
jgi:hypothetical protein